MNNFFTQLSGALKSAQKQSKPFAVHAIALAILVGGWVGYSLYQPAMAFGDVGPQYPGGDFSVSLKVDGQNRAINDNDPVEPYNPSGSQLSINMLKTSADSLDWNVAYYEAGIQNVLTGEWTWYNIGSVSKADITNSDPNYSYYTFRWKPGYDVAGNYIVPMPSTQVVIGITLGKNLDPNGGNGTVVGRAWSTRFVLAKLAIQRPDETNSWAIENLESLAIKFAQAPVKTVEVQFGAKVNGQTVFSESGETTIASLAIAGGGTSTYFTGATWDKVGYTSDGQQIAVLPSDKVQIYASLCYTNDVCEYGVESRVFKVTGEFVQPIFEPGLGDVWHLGEVRTIKWTVPAFNTPTASAAYYIKYGNAEGKSLRTVGYETVTQADIGKTKTHEYMVGEEGKHANFTQFPMHDVKVEIRIMPSDTSVSYSIFSDPFVIDESIYKLDILSPETLDEQWMVGEIKNVKFKVSLKPNKVEILTVKSRFDFRLAGQDIFGKNTAFWNVRDAFEYNPVAAPIDHIYNFDWLVDESPNGNSLLEMYPEREGQDIMIMGKIGDRVELGAEYVGEKLQIVRIPIVVLDTVAIDVSGPAFWGDTETVTINFADARTEPRYIDIFLVGMPTGTKVPYELANNVEVIGATKVYDWFVDQDAYCSFDLNQVEIMVREHGSETTLGYSELFDILTGYKFMTPEDGTCQVPFGALPEPEIFTSGETMHGQIEWTPNDGGSTASFDEGVFIKEAGENAEWTRIVEQGEFTYPPGFIEFDWTPDAVGTAYNATLMYARQFGDPSDPFVPIDPDNVGYFARTYPITILAGNSGPFDQVADYLSPMIDFNFATPLAPPPLESLGTFIAQDDSASGSISYAVSFYKEDGTRLGATTNPPFDGWFNAQSDLSAIKTDHSDWFGEIRSAQFRATLSAYANDPVKPRVYAMSLDYAVNQQNEIALINFEDGTLHRVVTQGQSTTIGMRVIVNPLFVNPESQYSMEVVLDMPEADANGMTIYAVPVSVPIAAGVSEALFDVTITTDATTPVSPPNYDFSISGIFTGTSYVAGTINGELEVVAVGELGGFTIEHEISGTRLVSPGDIATYKINIIRDTDFVDSITFNASSAVINGWSTFLPNPVSSNSTTLSVIVPDDATTPQTIDFYVIGTAGDITRNVVASLQILDVSDVATLNLTIPIEEGAIHKTNIPAFVLRLYQGFQRVFESDAFYTNASNQASITVPMSLLESGTEYTPLTRSTRHLWAEGNKFTIDGSASYDISFSKLLAGDIYRDDASDADSFTSTINTLDLGMVLSKYGQSGERLEDLDNNDYVNTLDLGFIIKNIFQSFIWNM